MFLTGVRPYDSDVLNLNSNSHTTNPDSPNVQTITIKKTITITQEFNLPMKWKKTIESVFWTWK